MTRAPASPKSWAATAPALPKPWTATRALYTPSSPGAAPRARARWVANRQPRAVASWRPCEPPSDSGLPVTTGRLLPPGCLMPEGPCPQAMGRAARAGAHLHGELEDDGPGRALEEVDQPGLDVGQVGDRPVELLRRDVEQVQVFGGAGEVGGHGGPPGCWGREGEAPAEPSPGSA